jgi:TolA-binding protein
MTKLRKVLGTSILSLLLVIWGLFMVCSGSVPEVNYDDSEFYGAEGTDTDDSELMDQLAVLDNQDADLDDSQREEIMRALGIQSAANEDNEFLNEELFLDLEVEIAELEKINQTNRQKIASLQSEYDESELQLAALETVVGTPERPAFVANDTEVIGNSPYAQAYQIALNDIYAHRYTEAINKFENLLKMDNSDNLADNAQYWIGEAYYALGNYEKAIAEFEKVFVYRNNNKIDDAQFMIGLAYTRVGESDMAQQELLNLLQFFQNSEYVPRAENRFNEIRI